MVKAGSLTGGAKAFVDVFPVFEKEDFFVEGTKDFSPNSKISYEHYQTLLKSGDIEKLRAFETELQGVDPVSGKPYLNLPSRARRKAKDQWENNLLRYCDGRDKENRNNPNSQITSARDAGSTEVVAGSDLTGKGDKWASDPDFKTADVLRINKTQCNRMSAYAKIEHDRLMAEARAMLDDAKAEGQNAVIFDLYAKATGATIVVLGVGTILSLGAIAIAKLPAILAAGGRALAGAGGVFAKMGWLGKLLSTSLAVSLPTLWGYAVQSFYFLYNFDFNMSDEAIDRQSTSGISALAGSLGGFVGSSLGWLACGLAPATAIAAADPLKGLLAKKELTEEMIEELSQEMWTVINQASRQVARAAFLQSYKHARRWIKEKDSVQYKIATQIFGKEAIKNWGDGKKPFTISGQINQAIEDIGENQYVQTLLGKQGAEALENFLEEAVEEFIDSCIEAGFVLSSAYSVALMQQNQQRTLTFGEMRTVEIEFNRSSS